MEQKLTQDELAIIDRAFRRGNGEDIKIINDLVSNPNGILVCRHFKQNDYVIIGISKHTETNELMVVYKRLSNDSEIFCRPYEMFISEVDRDKYPNVDQKYRMEIKEFIILNDNKLATILNLLRLSISNMKEEKVNNETI